MIEVSHDIRTDVVHGRAQGFSCEDKAIFFVINVTTELFMYLHVVN